MKVAGLFAGIGGIELGFQQTGDFSTEFLCGEGGSRRLGWR